MAKKSTFLAYVLLLIGGFWAWHLLYLKRSRQAVLYCCTFGGFGMGLIYDFLNIPRYVSEANLEEDFVEVHLVQRRQHGRLDITWERCAAEIIFASILGYGVMAALPESLLKEYSVFYYIFLCGFCPIAVAYGVWFVGGIGSQRLDFVQSMIGSLLTLPLLFRSGPSNLFYSALSSTIWSNYRGKRLRSLKEIDLEQKQSYFTHLFKFCVFICFVYGLWFSTFYNNATITTHDGVEVPVSEAIHNFLNSQAYQDIKTVLADFVMTLFSHGPGQAWHRFIRVSDPLGEDSAFKVLELEPGASESDIERHCRKMLREHHPDRFRDEEKKKEEHNIFLNVQLACDRLSTIRQRRIQRNRQSVSKDEL